jgi:hypothetical protein
VENQDFIDVGDKLDTIDMEVVFIYLIINDISKRTQSFSRIAPGWI